MKQLNLPFFRKAFAFTVLSSILFVSQVSAQTIIGRQRVDQYPVNQWGTMAYGLTYLPSDYNNNNKDYPLIIFLHGSGENGNSVWSLYNLLSQALPQKIANGWEPQAVNPKDGKTYKFIVVSPQAPQWSMNGQQVEYILEDVKKRYRVDASRVYVTGLSAGGAGTWGAVTNGKAYAKKIAAVVPVSAAGTNNPAEEAQLPYVGGAYGAKAWSICGTGDTFWGLAVKFTDIINKNKNKDKNDDDDDEDEKGKDPALATGLKGAGHDGSAWNTAYDPNWRNNSENLNIYEWMLKYKRGKSTSSGSNTPANLSPTANGGGDQSITLPKNFVQVSGSGTDADGSVAAYSWSKVSGPGQPTILSAGQAQTSITNLVQGTYTFRLTVTDNKGATATDDIVVVVSPAPAAPVVVPPAPPVVTPPATFTTIPARIEAEKWSNMKGVQAETSWDAGGGQNVAYIDNADWIDYNISAPTAGSYTINFRIATPNSGAKFEVLKSNGDQLTTVNVPKTGGYQNWQTVSATVSLAQGNQTIRLESTGGGMWNINWMEFTASTGGVPPVVVPNLPAGGASFRIEAENYSNMKGVQKESTWDAGGGQNIGYIDYMDWMDYSISPSAAGTYSVKFRVATPNRNAQFQVLKSDGTVLTTVTPSNTGGFQTWQNVTVNLNLAAGQQTIRLVSTGGGMWNINWMEFNAGGANTAAAENNDVEVSIADNTGGTFDIFPNPVQDRFALQVTNGLTGEMKVQVVNINGAVQKEFRINKANGSSQTYLSLGNLPAGQYIISVKMKGWTETKKIIKQ